MKSPLPDLPDKRWTAAPGLGGRTQPGQLTGVFLEKDEQVQWSWTLGPDGSKTVTGYQIISKKKAPARKKQRMGFGPD